MGIFAALTELFAPAPRESLRNRLIVDCDATPITVTVPASGAYVRLWESQWADIGGYALVNGFTRLTFLDGNPDQFDFRASLTLRHGTGGDFEAASVVRGSQSLILVQKGRLPVLVTDAAAAQAARIVVDVRTNALRTLTAKVDAQIVAGSMNA